MSVKNLTALDISKLEKNLLRSSTLEDIHKNTASILFDIPVESVSTEQRKIGKVFNYHLMYGNILQNKEQNHEMY